ncbi:lysozyme inhibitor LprI family protein [Lichenicoccus sp.]|uniref:lysozyme inhibitor LprI family protein n=1 Tax=Lichenicoccus sp. TaxID=2781899 RepID=UPI003D0963C7
MVVNELPEYKACLLQAGGNTPSVEECNTAEIADLSRKLSIAYQKVASLRQDLAQDLKVSQKAWKDYVYKECALQGSWLAGGGSGLLPEFRTTDYVTDWPLDGGGNAQVEIYG